MFRKKSFTKFQTLHTITAIISSFHSPVDNVASQDNFRISQTDTTRPEEDKHAFLSLSSSANVEPFALAASRRFVISEVKELSLATHDRTALHDHHNKVFVWHWVCRWYLLSPHRLNQIILHQTSEISVVFMCDNDRNSEWRDFWDFFSGGWICREQKISCATTGHAKFCGAN